MKRSPASATKRKSKGSLDDGVQSALAWLKRHSSKANRDGMARYAIPSDNALGVSVANIRVLGKRLGRNHELAGALWDTGVYEARMLTSFVDEPERVTAAQMDRWSRDFDNWAIVDTDANGNDLPAGGSRIHTPGIGVHRVWVNGKLVADSNGILKDAPKAGKVLREFSA